MPSVFGSAPTVYHVRALFRHGFAFVIALVAVLGFTVDYGVAQPLPEKIISRKDADAIFSMTRSQWEEHAKQFVHPLGWPMRPMPIDTGTGFAAVDPTSGIRVTLQPLYKTPNDPPDMIVVGNWYPAGQTPITPEFVARVQRAAQEDLGANYMVTASLGAASGLEGIELLVRRK